MPSNSNRYRIRAVERTLDLLSAFSPSDRELTLTELSSRLALSTSTTYRILVTLESRGYVEHNSQSGGYSLGVACLDLGAVVLAQLDLRGRVLPVLEALREEYRETVHLGILDRSRMEVVYLEKLEGLQAIGMMGSRVGGRAPAYCTGLGKCMLAYFPERDVRDFYAANGLRVRTTNTITVLEALLGDLRETRNRGYAIDNVEHEDGVRCVAAPVWNHENVVVGALSISGPEQRMGQLIGEADLVDRVRASAYEASTRMGYARRVAVDQGVAD